MPAFGDFDEPISVLAARSVRAGLIWRHAAALWKYGTPSRDGTQRILDRHALERGVPATGLQPQELAAFFQRYWPIVRLHTDTDRYRVEAMLAGLWRTRTVDGDIVECGSYRCGLGFLFAFAVKEWGLRKTVHLYDSFEGLPPLADADQAESPDNFFYEGQFQRGDLLGNAHAFLAEHHLEDVVELHQGWFEQTLPHIPAGRRISFAHIDCDLYESALTCWQYLTPHCGDGACIVVDDYDSPGMYSATWEYLAERQFPLYVGALKQAHFFTGTVAGTSAGTSVGQEDWSPLLANRPYCAHLASLCGDMIVACSGPANGPRDEKLNAVLDRMLGSEHKVSFLEHLIAYLYRQV